VSVWERLAPDLADKGVLTSWDAGLFALHCQLEVLLARSAQLLDAATLVKGRRDGLVTNPAWRVFRDGLREYVRTCREFGLTPSARFELRAGGLGPDPRKEEQGQSGTDL
jgi:P27 family predicted phage terminase small subunit